MSEFKKKGVYSSTNTIYITDDCEENTVDVFKSTQNDILICTTYDFGVDGLSIKLDKNQVEDLIKFLQSTL